MSHFHLPHWHVPHLHIAQLFSWRDLKLQVQLQVQDVLSPAQQPPRDATSSKSASGALALLLAVLSTALGAAVLSTRLEVKLVEAPRLPQAVVLSLSTPGEIGEAEHDPFDQAKREAIAEELPPQF